MWKRSEVERLTGLERHVIQNLCNKNTSRDGLGFWEPAVMKPGYSRFDRNDLLAFYLVRQLTKIGFAPAEMRLIVASMLGEGGAFGDRLRGRAGELEAQRARIDEQIDALGRMGEVAAYAPQERLRETMRVEVVASAERSLGAASRRRRFALEQIEDARAALRLIADELVEGVWEPGSGRRPSEVEKCVALLMGGHVEPTSEEAQHALRDSLAREGGADGAGVLLVGALSEFLSEPGNGVPVELAWGKGSFIYLGQVASTLALRLGA